MCLFQTRHTQLEVLGSLYRRPCVSICLETSKHTRRPCGYTDWWAETTSCTTSTFQYMPVAVCAPTLVNPVEGNYTFEPGQDKKSGCISTGRATFLYLACWSWCQDKRQASTSHLMPHETNGLFFYFFILFYFFYCTCSSFWRWNDGSLCEFNQDLWNTGLVPCGKRPHYTRVGGNGSFFWTHTQMKGML